MKRALWLAGCCLVAGTAASTLHADNAPVKIPPAPAAINPSTGAVIAGSSDALQRPSLPPAAGASPTVPAPPPGLAGPTDLTMPVDLSTDPEIIADRALELSRENQGRSEEEEAAEVQQQRNEAAQHDWMLRAYQEQLRKNGLTDTAAKADPYGLNADKPAGETANDPADDPLLPEPATPDQPKRAPAGQEDAAALVKKVSAENSLLPESLPPLLPPLNSPDNPSSPTHDYFGGTFDPNQPIVTPPVATAPAPTATDSILDVPGLTAAQQTGLPDEDANAALEDRLPDEPADQTRPHPEQDNNNFMLPTAPTNDIDTFYKKQTAALLPPTAPTIQAPPALALPKPYEEPPHLAKPVVDGLRNHVADPFDFLNR